MERYIYRTPNSYVYQSLRKLQRKRHGCNGYAIRRWSSGGAAVIMDRKVRRPGYQNLGIEERTWVSKHTVFSKKQKQLKASDAGFFFSKQNGIKLYSRIDPLPFSLAGFAGHPEVILQFGQPLESSDISGWWMIFGNFDCDWARIVIWPANMVI